MYRQAKANANSSKNMLLLKNLQFVPNHCETLSQNGTNEYLFVTKFRNDWVQIADFLIKAYFCSSSHLPSPVCNFVLELNFYFLKF